ncbi:MAG: RHS domain-containing protein [Alteromonadaceae bacterium]|nr:RHS domain-containing protein [Alteromonadaceae bacterium]
MGNDGEVLEYSHEPNQEATEPELQEVLVTGYNADFPTSSSGEVAGTYYYHNDHLGTPQVMTDSNATVVWRANYDPFGKADIVVEKVTNNIRFPGQYFDQESGLHHNYFRDYDPDLGRYIQSDPIGLAGGINTYGYVDGNPISYVDPYGLRSRARVRQGNFLQPLINGQVQLLINQIRQLEPNFSYRTVRPSRGPNSSHGRNDIVFLQNVLRNTRENSQCSINGNYNPTGKRRKGSTPFNIVSEYGPLSIRGTPFSIHSLSRMQGRGIPPSAVLNALRYGVTTHGNKPNTTMHRYENISVVTNSTTGTIITVGYGG